MIASVDAINSERMNRFLISPSEYSQCVYNLYEIF
jgi:hypothetical protein